MSNNIGVANLVDRCRQFICRGRKRALTNSNQNRNINFNHGLIGKKFVSNQIATNKYSLITFFPKFLYEQFRKYSNVFFLCIVIFQQIPGVSPTGRFTTAVPLAFILFCAALKEIVEDIKRQIQDRQVNRRQVLVYEQGNWVTKRWHQVQVGDFIKVQNDENFPADLLFLSSSELNSICYVETSNLDGETNLKVHQSLPQSAHIHSLEQLSTLRGTLECDLPNRNLYEFSGTLNIEGVEHPIPINIKQILLRGSKLKSTKWILGLVIYSGHDTKLMMNSSAVPSKQTNVDRQTNRQILLLLALLFALCLFSTIASEIWVSKNRDHHWYLAFNEGDIPSKIATFFLTFLTFFILYNNLIPISLQITVDLVKFIQAFFINWDREMYDPETDTPANARTSNLNEELGQIKYVFSDKTGTLTRNEMVFRECSIAGQIYESTDPSKFVSPALMADMEKDMVGSQIREFFTLLATCHTVIPDQGADTEDPNKLVYQASSPDEFALVSAAKDVGAVFYHRKPHNVSIRYRGQIEEYRILNVLEFNSDRKRMSVILRTPDYQIKLFCKGADSIILERLRPDDPLATVTSAHLETFAKNGLRTLCFASRNLSLDEYNEWSAEYTAASIQIRDREKAIDAVAEKIERNLTLLGASGIEDKLQEKVPESLTMLLKAGIKVWVLTGDKKETAINIAYSCQLISDSLENYILDFPTLQETKSELEKISESIDTVPTDEPTCSLIIEGKTLSFALENECRELFLRIALVCRTVICCRVTPRQKAEVVELVKKSVSATTLAIGDGANDVAMIQMAHVGIGIMGREGVQAASASDYSIGQFQYLTRLLFVHGVWNYRRLCKVLLYSFYKNICLYVMELWFAFNNGFSGQILFEQWTIGVYNVLFTAAPPMAIGLLDRSCKAETIMNNPAIYETTQSGSEMNNKVFWTWTLNAVYHSILLYTLSTLMMRHDVAVANGQVGDHYFLGNIIYTYTVCLVCMRAGLETESWTWLTHLAIWGSIVFWFLFLIVYSFFWGTFPVGAEMYGMVNHVFASGSFWFGLICIPIATLFTDFIHIYIERTYFKSLIQDAQEKDALPQGTDESRQSRRLSVISRFHEGSALIRGSVRNLAPKKLAARYLGFAFSQEERGTIRQTQLVSSEGERSNDAREQY